MSRGLAAVCGVAATVAALGLGGCSPRGETPAAASAVQAPAAVAPAPQPGPLPPPDALTAVMNRLADPTVPGAEKLNLVEDAAPPDAATLDRFAAALRDGGFTAASFTASEIRWSDSRPGDVVATVTATAPESATTTAATPPAPGPFAFPMEFRLQSGGWQLSRETAEMLLAFGNAGAAATTDSAAKPAPGREAPAVTPSKGSGPTRP